MDLFVAMRTFVEVVQTGSMNGAARKMNVTPALVGQRVAALEDHLQLRLLNRTTRQQSLTDFGIRYLEQCRDILEQVALSETIASDQHSQPEGLLRITAPVSFGTEALIPALSDFSDMQPKVALELVLSDSNEDLIAVGVDAAFRVGELEDSTLMQARLAPYEMVLCAAPDYLSRAGIPHTPHDLEQHLAVLFTRTCRSPWRFFQAGQQLNWTPRPRLIVNTGHGVRQGALAGMGLALLPRVLAGQDIERGTLIAVLPDWELTQKPLSLVYHRDRYMPQRLLRFVEFAKKRFGRG